MRRRLHRHQGSYMFQVGFWECVVVGIVALWALGPERLPAVARVCGRYVLRLKNTMQGLKKEFEAELRDDL